jgi:23S rRNA pseudouridine1911/1915/1917 synthase
LVPDTTNQEWREIGGGVWFDGRVAKPDSFELPDGTIVNILYEDRGVLAIDKPAGWMLGPDDGEHADRGLHRALVDAIETGEWWARSRNLKFLRFVHRLDAPTTGVLLFSKSQGAMPALSRVFAERTVKKAYLAVTDGVPRQGEWVCREPLGPDPAEHGKHRVDYGPEAKPAETAFRVLGAREGRALVLALPVTGRTHQIRLHLAHAGCPVAGDILYGRRDFHGLALRAFRLEYPDPFLRRSTLIIAPTEVFCRRYGYDPLLVPEELRTRPRRPVVPGGKPSAGSRGASEAHPQGKPASAAKKADRVVKQQTQRPAGQRPPDRSRGQHGAAPKQ